MNPAIQSLLRFHAASRWRRVKHSISSKRRLLLTLGAISLGILWLGQTIASIVLREPYAPESFHRYASLIVTMYFLWHIVRVAYKRPDDAIEWSGPERELIVGGTIHPSRDSHLSVLDHSDVHPPEGAAVGIGPLSGPVVERTAGDRVGPGVSGVLSPRD